MIDAHTHNRISILQAGEGRLWGAPGRFRDAKGSRVRLAFRAGSVWLAAWFALGLWTSSLSAQGGGGAGQDFYVSDPATEKVINGAGVDLRSLQYQYSQVDLQASGGDFSLVRGPGKEIKDRINPFGNFSHNWDIYIWEKHKSLPTSENFNGGVDFSPSVNGGSLANVVFGPQEESFHGRPDNWYTPGYVPQADMTLSGRLTYTGNYPQLSGGDTATFTWTSNSGVKVEFRALSSRDCLTEHFLEGYSYARCAFAHKVTRPDGEQFDLVYDNFGTNTTRLRRVESSRGYALLFEYGVGNQAGLVSKSCLINLSSISEGGFACPASAEQVSTYSYVEFDGSMRLASVTDPVGETHSFSYNSATNPNIMGVPAVSYEMSFYRPGETAPWQVQQRGTLPNRNSGDDEVVRAQLFADGSSLTYDPKYPGTTAEGKGFAVVQGSTSTNSLGDTFSVTYASKKYPTWLMPPPPPGVAWTKDDYMWQTSSQPTLIRDELSRTISQDFCVYYTDPEGYPPAVNGNCEMLPNSWMHTTLGGFAVETARDGNGLVTEQKRLAHPSSEYATPPYTEITETLTWAPCDLSRILCGKPETYTNALGETIDYEYSSTHGGLTRKTLPADANGVRPETRYSYVQKYAWILKAGGGFEQASSPVWVLASEEYCRTSAADANGDCAAGAADEVVTTYEYQEGSVTKGSNVWLVGTAVTADGQTLRSCISYDSYGRKVSETSPRAGLASCQ